MLLHVIAFTEEAHPFVVACNRFTEEAHPFVVACNSIH